MLELKNVSKKYENEDGYILDNINLKFNNGLTAIVGESGSGKSTLLNIIGGLDTNYFGKLYFNDNLIDKNNIDLYKKNNIGFIFQSFNLLPNLTAYENVKIMSDLHSKNNKNKILELFENLNISNILNKKPNELSGGQKQRVAIARALINDPDIILADEPTGALDKKNSQIVLNILKEISKDKIVIVVTHSKKVSENADNVIEIFNSKTVTRKKKDIKNMVVFEKKQVKKTGLKTLLNISLKNILRNLKRNLLIIIGSSIGIFGISFMLFLSSGIKNYVKKEIDLNLNPKLVEVNKSNNILDISYFNEKDIDKIRSIDNIKKINKQLTISNLSSLQGKDKYDLTSLSTFDSLNKSNIEYGKVSKNNEIVISKNLAEKLENNYKDAVGKSYDLYIIENSIPKVIKENVKVSGIIKEEFLDTMSYGYINYKYLEEIYNKNDIKLNPSVINVEVDDVKNVDSVKKKLKKLGFSTSNSTKFLNKILDYVDIISYILIGISSISLIVSSIMILVVMYINVIERTKEIGIFRAFGVKVSEIKKMFIFESSLIGLFSGIYGCLISSLLGLIINKFTYANYKSNFIDINIKSIVFSVLISVIVSTISGLKPAKKASKLNTIDSLRYE